MQHHRAYTLARIRQLRAIGGVRKRPGRLPRQAQPDAIRLDYFNALRHVVDGAREAFDVVHDDMMHLLVRARGARADARQFQPGETREALGLVERAAKRYTEAFRPHELEAVARRFGQRTSDFQREQLDRQVRAAMGVPFGALEKPIADNLDAFARENVDLIKTVPERYFDRLRADVEQAFTDGTHPEDLAEQIADRYDMALDDARRIARDQVGKLNADVNQARQEALGVEGYLWRGMNDNRERDEHREREGQFFRWNDPPEDGHPGEAVQCRCYSEPVFSDLSDDSDTSSG